MNEMSGYPNMRMNCVDVKDCSKAHFRALTRKDAAGKRFILSQEKDMPMIEVADLLFEALEENGYNYPMTRRAVGFCTLKFASYFSAEIAFILPMCNKPAVTMINKQSRELLSIEYKRSIKELVLETTESMMK